MILPWLESPFNIFPRSSRGSWHTKKCYGVERAKGSMGLGKVISSFPIGCALGGTSIASPQGGELLLGEDGYSLGCLWSECGTMALYCSVNEVPFKGRDAIREYKVNTIWLAILQGLLGPVDLRNQWAGGGGYYHGGAVAPFITGPIRVPSHSRLRLDPQVRVGQPANFRRFLHGVLYLRCTGIPWRDLPTRFGYWHSVFRRHWRW